MSVKKCSTTFVGVYEYLWLEKNDNTVCNNKKLAFLKLYKIWSFKDFYLIFSPQSPNIPIWCWFNFYVKEMICSEVLGQQVNNGKKNQWIHFFCSPIFNRVPRTFHNVQIIACIGSKITSAAKDFIIKLWWKNQLDCFKTYDFVPF